MKYFALFFLGLFSLNSSFAMNHNGNGHTDVESSDSESEDDDKPEEMYMQLDLSGNYLFYFNMRAVNKSSTSADLMIGVSINNTKASYKKYKLDANSNQLINDIIPVKIHSTDLVQVKINAPETVDLIINETEFIFFEPKNKL